MSMPEHRSQALGNYSIPGSKKGLRVFLGSMGFYRRYVDQLASHTSLLTPLMTKQAPHRIVWA